MNKVRVDSPHRRRRFTVFLVIALAFIGGAFYEYNTVRQQNSQADERGTLSVQTQESDNLVSAQHALGRLAVKERVSRQGYSRAKFSSGWAVVEGCDMRNRILKRDLRDVVIDQSNNCTVLSGVLADDPFTGKTIQFKRGKDTSGAVHIEHLIAVSDAWQKGAQDLSKEERHAFYNDPLNLVAVDGPANMQKGDADASKWLPHKAYQCRYVARQIAVKLKYYLWVTKNEYNAMKRVLNTCPQQVLPIETAPASP